MIHRALSTASLCLAALFVVGCRRDPAPPSPPDSAAIPGASASATAITTTAPSPKPGLARSGGALLRAEHEPALYVADEDQNAIRRIPLPADPTAPIAEVKLPGPPAQIASVEGHLLVTVRGLAGDAATPLHGPGLLLFMKPNTEKTLVEEARVELPADAWGIAVTPDERIAIVTSAWTHKVSAVDLEHRKLLWSVDVGREPRGVAIRADGASAYVTHLVRASLTRIDDLRGSPKVRVVPFPAAPGRTIAERADAATLGYAPVLSPDGSRLYLARQALGATGSRTWAGQGTVDILLTEGESPLVTRPERWYVMQAPDFLRGWELDRPKAYGVTGPSPIQEVRALAEPRAAVYRKATETLLVASEGNDTLVELDALAVDPALDPLRVYDLRRPPGKGRPLPNDKTIEGTLCGAPSGLALSEDETRAYVLCRSSHEIAVVKLDPLDSSYEFVPEAQVHLSLGPDALPEKAALGRRLFYQANDPDMSGGMACAGCHPEGRDDGHVWREDTPRSRNDGPMMHAFEVAEDGELRKGRPRQTPMLVGRVSALGPYGWKAESKTLRRHIVTGFAIHNWSGGWPGSTGNARADAIIEFLRAGLTKPPREVRADAAAEQRGEVLFRDPNVGCADCHSPGTEYTNRARLGFGEWAVDTKRADPEPDDWLFKTPSLLFVGGSPPYYHDGSEPSLESLIEHNGTRMGHTKQLSPDDRAALVAFLKTL